MKLGFILLYFFSFNLAGAEISRSVFEAAEKGDFSQLKQLVHKGVADLINPADENGKTALMYAAENGHFEMVKTLLTHKIEIVFTTDEGWFWDVKKETTVEYGSDVINAKDRNGKTASMYAKENGHFEVVELLEEKLEEKLEDEEEEKPEKRLDKLVFNLAGAEASLSLLEVAKKGNLIQLEGSIQKGINDLVSAADENGKTALIYAAENGHFEMVKTLLSNRIVIVFTTDGWFMSSDEEIILGYGFDLINAKDRNGKTASMYAEENGHPKIVELLEKKLEEKFEEMKEQEYNVSLSLVIFLFFLLIAMT